MKHLFTMVALMGFVSTFAQKVETYVAKDSAVMEAITWMKDGRIFVDDFTNGNLFKITGPGEIELVQSGIAGVLGGAQDDLGNYYYSEFQSGSVFRVDVNDSITLVTSGLSGPTGLVVDDANRILYISNFNASAVTAYGLESDSSWMVAQLQGINGPDGLIFTDEGDLLVANFNDNKIHRIQLETKEVRLFSEVKQSPNTGYIAKTQNANDETVYYTAGFYGHNIISIDRMGNAALIAGSDSDSAGYIDGSFEESRFNFPNGIAISPSGDSMLIAESNAAGRVRLITGFLDLSTNVKALEINGLSVYPNPVTDELKFEMDWPEDSPLKIELIDSAAKTLAVIYNDKMAAGNQMVTWKRNDQIPAGVYWLRFTSADKQYSQELIIAD